MPHNALKANPGGQLAPSDILGREALALAALDTLRRQGIVATAERRIGKTSLITKMVALADPTEFLILSRSVENVKNSLEFAEQVYAQIEHHLPALQKAKGKLRTLVGHLAGVELGGIIKFPDQLAKHWKDLLQSAIADLAEHAREPYVVLIWDELTLMMQKIQADEGDRVAMDLLDTLRSLRQTHHNLRMLYTGSVGLHHVTSSLRAAGHTNDATNDMRMLEVPELDEPDAIELAKALMRGEALDAADPENAAATIANECDRIAYYIHHVITKLKEQRAGVTSDAVKKIVAHMLVDPNDPWHLKYFRDRLENYYGADRLPVVLHILDEVACSNEPVHTDRLLKTLPTAVKRKTSPIAAKILDGNKEPLHAILDLLQRDHYLRRIPDDGRYTFRFPIIQRWWRIQRGGAA